MSRRPTPKDTLSDVLTRLELELSALNDVTQRGASQKARRSAEKGLAALISRAEDLRKQLDPTSYPELVLDPTKPSVVARLIAPGSLGATPNPSDRDHVILRVGNLCALLQRAVPVLLPNPWIGDADLRWKGRSAGSERRVATGSRGSPVEAGPGPHPNAPRRRAGRNLVACRFPAAVPRDSDRVAVSGGGIFDRALSAGVE